MKRSSLLPVVGTVAAITALGVTIALVQPGDRAPRPLRLAAGGDEAARDAAPMAAGSSSSGYTLTGTLPAGRPDDAPAYTLPAGPAPASLVGALAKALEAGTAERDGDGWRAGGLFVSGDAGRSWWFSPCAADQPVASDERVACAVDVGVATADPAPADGGGSAPGNGTATPEEDPVAPSSAPSGSSGSSTTASPPPAPSPAPEPDPMPQDAVRAAAAPVFQALGLPLAEARIDAYAYGGSATLTRTVGGLEVSGMQTSVQVARDGSVQGAGGFLAVPVKGDSYPLVTAEEAYDDLPPMMTTQMSCPVGPDGKGCAEPQPTEITGARLGLMLSALVDGGQALVPAWLFEVKGWTEPLAVVAVQQKYLPQPSPEPTSRPDPGGSTEPDPGGGTEPGQVPPAPPAGSDPGAARQDVRIDKAYAGKGDTLVAVYGESGSCPLTGVTSQVKESADTVYVALQADALEPDRLCTADHRPAEHVVTLQAPLGDRAVVDLSTNKAVPRA